MNHEINHESVKPYSFGIHGDIAQYIIEQEKKGESNFFYGAEPFRELKDRELIVPRETIIYLDNELVQNNVRYIVTKKYLLEAQEPKNTKECLFETKEGLYYPLAKLDKKVWSIQNLDI